MKLRIEGTHPPKYIEGYRISDATQNYAVEKPGRRDIYVPVGAIDGESIYRKVGEERTA